MTNNEKLNGCDIHFTILKLKEFMYKSRKISSSEELDLLISEVKQFVTNDKLLSQEYYRQINNFKNFESQNNEFFANIVDNINNINNIIKITVGNTSPLQNIAKVFYFGSLKDLIKENSTIAIPQNNKHIKGIIPFYKENISNALIKLNFSTDKQLEIQSFFDDLPLELKESVNYNAIHFEDYIVLDFGLLVNDFFIKWLNSALFGMLFSLLCYSKKQIPNFNEDIKKIGIALQAVELIKNDALYLGIIQYLISHPKSSMKELESFIAKTYNYTTIRRHLAKICGFFGRETDISIKGVKACINKYKLETYFQ